MCDPLLKKIIILITTVLYFCAPVHAKNAWPPENIILQNKKVKAIIEIGKNDRLHEKYYHLSKDGKWTLVLTQFSHTYTATDSSDTQLWNTTINPYRFLIQEMKVTGLTKKISKDGETVKITLKQNGQVFTQEISLGKNDAYFHIEVNGNLQGSVPRLDYMLSAYTFNYKGTPQFVHTPGLKFDDARSGKGRDQVLGDRAFHSPAVILQQKNIFAAMIPDLNIANSRRVLSYDARNVVLFKPSPVFLVPVPADRVSMPAGIDLNVHTKISPSPILTYGLMDSKVGFHTRFVREEKDTQMVRKLYNGKISYGFDLLVNAVDADQAGYSLASKHLWKHFGEPVFDSAPHLAMPFKDYLEQVKSKIFFPIRDSNGKLYNIPGGTIDPPVEGYRDNGSWLEWETDNVKLGGFRCSAPFWSDVINNSVFWNQARDAVGMHYWGRELNDTFLTSKAKMIINFCLSAPRNEYGLFSTVFSAKDKKWGMGWSDPPRGENKLFMRDAKTYEIHALSKTGAHLLDYYMREEKDPRIIGFLTPFANWLVTVVDEKGIIPSYVTGDMKISPILYESAQPAAGMWFLAEMYNATKDEKFLAAAKKIAAYIEKEIIPTAKWIDMEQYVSCGQKPFTMTKDDWQGQWFRGNLCIMWASEGFAALHRATHDKKWLASGEKCIDYLSFTQAGWSPHFVYTANPFGGFGTDNGDDAAMMDQRQAEFVKAYVYYGLQLNRQDLLERGVAAGRSGCVLINNKRHIQNGIAPSPLHYPEGFAPENIDHEGISQWPMRTHPLWGEGTAVFTGLSEVRRSLGGLYIDLDNDIIVGSDGIRIIKESKNKDGSYSIDFSSFLSPAYLKMPFENNYNITAIIKGYQSHNLLLNGKPVKDSNVTLLVDTKN